VPRVQPIRFFDLMGAAAIATPTTQRDAEARDLCNDRPQLDMTRTFLKAIEDRLLVAALR
jgi:hypothetical protein